MVNNDDYDDFLHVKLCVRYLFYESFIYLFCFSLFYCSSFRLQKFAYNEKKYAEKEDPTFILKLTLRQDCIEKSVLVKLCSI